MKAGSGDNPFDDPVSEGEEENEETPTETEVNPEPSPDDPSVSASVEETDESAESGHSESIELPYIFSRDTVKEGRDQVPFFLREHVQNEENEFIDELEDRLGEDVYKADAREAALLVAYRYPEKVATELRDWGYDHD